MEPTSEGSSPSAEADAGAQGDEDHRIYHRKIEPDPDEPHLGVLYSIAEVEECDVEDLPPLYDYVDHLVEKLFQTPPPTKAQVQIDFTYYHYRVLLDQEGNLTLMRQAEPLELD